MTYRYPVVWRGMHSTGGGSAMRRQRNVYTSRKTPCCPGSIRLPAHFCGIAGLKPTSGRVPRTGHVVPFGMGAVDALTQNGPMARYVEDLALILPLIAGVDGIDPAIVPMPLAELQDVDLQRLRVAVHTDNGIKTPTPEIIAAVRTAAQALQR